MVVSLFKGDQGRARLATEKFIALDPLKINIAIPLKGVYYHIGPESVPDYVAKEYPMCTPYDICVHTPYYPGFFYTYEEYPLMLILTIEPDFYRVKHPIRHYATATHLVEGKMKYKLLADIGELCTTLPSHNEDEKTHPIQKIMTTLHHGINNSSSNGEQSPSEILDQLFLEFEKVDSLNKSVKDVIKETGYSRSYASSQFKKLTHMTIMDYQRLLRVQCVFNFIANDRVDEFDDFYGRYSKAARNTLKHVTNLTYRDIKNRLLPKSLLENPKSSAAYLDFLSYTLLSNKTEAKEGTSRKSREQIIQIVEGNSKYMQSPKKPWKELADLNTFRFNQNVSQAHKIKHHIDRIGYKKYRLQIYYRDDGKLFTEDDGDFRPLNVSSFMKVVQLFANSSQFIINVDFFTLNSIDIQSFTNQDMDSFFEKMLYEKKCIFGLHKLNAIGRENLTFSLSLGDVLTRSLTEDQTQKYVDFYRIFMYKIKTHLCEKSIRWGIHFTKVTNASVKQLDDYLELLSVQNRLPAFIGIDLDNPEHYRQSSNIYESLVQLEIQLKLFKEKVSQLKDKWDITFYLSQLYFYSTFDFSDVELQDLFISILVPEIFAIISPPIENLGRLTLMGEKQRISAKAMSKDGFKSPLYHALMLGNHIDGQVIFKNSHCIIIEDGHFLFVWVYSDTKRSCTYRKMIPSKWNYKLILKDKPGNYKVTHLKIDKEYGNYHSLLKRFKSKQLLSDTEWNYINRLNAPYMQNYSYLTKNDLVIDTELAPFNIHLYILERS